VTVDRLGGRWFQPVAAHAGSAYLRYSFTKGTAQEVAFLWDALGLAAGMRLLDVGCGPGRHAAAFGKRGVEVVGVDISDVFLGLMGGSARPVLGDARCLPVRAASFDAAISLCQGGFGLLGGNDDGLVLAEMARAVRPGGRVAVSAFSAYFAVRYLEDGDDFDAATGVNRERAEVRNEAGEARQFDLWTTCFTPRELMLLAARSGLSVEGVWSVGPGDYCRRPPDLDHPEWLLLAAVVPSPGLPADPR
jgi:SAM-dependent methyltransferase